MTTVPLPNSLAARDAASILHPYTDAVSNATSGPLVVTRGEGVYVFDENGRKYLDGMAGLWCATLGFSNERLAEVAANQIRTLGFYHAFTQKSHAPQVELAERLLELAPVPMSKVFFCNSGSEANDTVIKLLWYRNNALGKPEKKKIIGRHRAYHGVTVAAASVTGTPLNHVKFDLPIAGFLHTDCPSYYRYAEPGESEEDFATRLADNLDKLIQSEGPETVAAFFAEPVMGSGGVIIPPPTYYDKIQKVLQKHDVLLVCDEVICGFGRTGNMWGAQTMGMEPDIMTFAKALSSGFAPISGIMLNEKIYRPIAEQSSEVGGLGHGFTYSGHPLSAAIALETLKIYEEIDIVSMARARAPAMKAGIESFAGHPLVGTVDSIGMLAVCELVANKETKEPFDPKKRVSAHLLARAQEHDLIIRALIDRIAFSPPLIITDEEIRDMFKRFGRALDETWEWVKSGG